MYLKQITPSKTVEAICLGDHLEFNLLIIPYLMESMILLFLPFNEDLLSLSLFASVTEY